MAALGTSKRFVARCQLNAFHGQISGQAVYLGQPCGFCVGKFLGDASEVFGQGQEGIHHVGIEVATPAVANDLYRLLVGVG